MTPTKKKPSKTERVARAAYNWWRSNRPIGWTEKQHAAQPLVNCVTFREDTLARAVARTVRKP